MTKVYERYEDLLKYRDLLQIAESQFGYDADCDQDGFFDCTDYKAEYDYWIGEKAGLKEGDQDYEFIVDVFVHVFEHRCYSCSGEDEVSKRADQFLKDYAQWRRDEIKRVGYSEFRKIGYRKYKGEYEV